MYNRKKPAKFLSNLHSNVAITTRDIQTISCSCIKKKRKVTDMPLMCYYSCLKRFDTTNKSGQNLKKRLDNQNRGRRSLQKLWGWEPSANYRLTLYVTFLISQFFYGQSRKSDIRFSNVILCYGMSYMKSDLIDILVILRIFSLF